MKKVLNRKVLIVIMSVLILSSSMVQGVVASDVQRITNEDMVKVTKLLVPYSETNDNSNAIDQAAVLKDSTLRQVVGYNTLLSLYFNDKPEITIMTVNELPNGKNFEEFMVKEFNNRYMYEENDNKLLILLVVKDGEYGIKAGKGIEKQLMGFNRGLLSQGAVEYLAIKDYDSLILTMLNNTLNYMLSNNMTSQQHKEFLEFLRYELRKDIPTNDSTRYAGEYKIVSVDGTFSKAMEFEKENGYSAESLTPGDYIITPNVEEGFLSPFEIEEKSIKVTIVNETAVFFDADTMSYQKYTPGKTKELFNNYLKIMFLICLVSSILIALAS